MSFLQIYVLLFCSIWLLLLFAFGWSIQKIPLFHQESESLDSTIKHWPRLSIIIPACNEAEHIEAAIQSLLQQDYPDLEIVAVNDRSTDETGNILNRLAEQDSRLKILHLDILPDGWLGKVNALNQGLKHTSGQWLLFTDADIYFKQGLLKRAVAFSDQQKVDHLALLPMFIKNSFWLDLSIVSFGLLFLTSSRAALVNRPNSKTPIGIGAFNLVRQDAFNKTPGFEWLRLEPGDDYGLGLMINKAGGKTHFSFADEDLHVPWYSSLKEMFKGLEKNMYGPGANYQWWRMILLVASLWALISAPLVAIVIGLINNSLVLLIPGLVVAGSHVAFSLLSHRDNRSETKQLLLFPVGLFLFSLMFLWSGFRCIKNGGIDWRGTHYTLKELRAGQRVKF